MTESLLLVDLVHTRPTQHSALALVSQGKRVGLKILMGREGLDRDGRICMHIHWADGRVETEKRK